jgi:CRP/FNR family cyclic AMP-dependent transcriptional regulator
MTEAAASAGGVTDKIRLLSRTALFKQMRQADLATLAAQTRDRTMRAGEVLFRCGDPGTTMLIILVGEVRIVLPSSDGREQVIRVLKAGDVLGELALLDGGSRTADAVAQTNGRLLIVERADLTEVLRNDPDLALALLTMLSGRLRGATGMLESMLFHDTAGRLASTLLTLSGGTAGRRLDITQGALGERVGAARETINRKLREWQAAGYIALEPGRITVLDVTGLRKLAPFSASAEDMQSAW